MLIKIMLIIKAILIIITLLIIMIVMIIMIAIIILIITLLKMIILQLIIIPLLIKILLIIIITQLHYPYTKTFPSNSFPPPIHQLHSPSTALPPLLHKHMYTNAHYVMHQHVALSACLHLCLEGYKNVCLNRIFTAPQHKRQTNGGVHMSWQ